MGGVSHKTGKPISNLESALESVEVIFATRIMSRVMRRHFAGGIIELLGKLVTPRLFSAFQALAVASIDVWEPRFRVRRLIFNGTTDQLRLGNVEFGFEVDWRPNGHLGDETVESIQSFRLKIAQGTVTAYQ